MSDASSDNIYTLGEPVEYYINIENCEFCHNEVGNTGTRDEQHGGAALAWFMKKIQYQR